MSSAGEEFPWTNFPGDGGLSLSEVRDALRVFASQPNLAAINVAGYNPEIDPDGKGAHVLIDLLVDILSTRIESVATEGNADGAAAVAAPGTLPTVASVPEQSPSSENLGDPSSPAGSDTISS